MIQTKPTEKGILVVEDDYRCLENLGIALRLKVLNELKPIKLRGDPRTELEERGIDVEDDYDSARELILGKRYKLVFLDHNIFVKDVGLKNVGYSLIPTIRKMNPGVYIIGISSNPPIYPCADAHLVKYSLKLPEDLEYILNHRKEGGN